MEKFDYTFSENLCEPLNTYFSKHIGQIIDDTVTFYFSSNPNCSDDELKKYIIKHAKTYIERKYWYITDQAFERMFSENTNMLKNIRMICYKMKYIVDIMKNSK